MCDKKELLILSPFEIPDVRLAVATAETGAFPVLHLGRDIEKAKRELNQLAAKIATPFGVCIATEEVKGIELPSQVTKVIAPLGMEIPASPQREVLYQVHSLQELEKAVTDKVQSIIIKGNEGAGRVADESSFILFQRVIERCNKDGLHLYIQGGAGLHSSAAYLALGAKGVIMDSQVTLFTECTVPRAVKDTCSKLSGNETVVIDGFRVLHRNNSPKLKDNPTREDIYPFLGGFSFDSHYLPMGQDVALSVDLVGRYKKLENFVSHFFETVYGHLHQVKRQPVIHPDNSLARDLGIKYPLAQGPMARISDVPEFINEVAGAGALPFLSLSLMFGKPAVEMIAKTKELLGEKTWGIGIMGFVPPQLREEQTKLILDAKPKVVLIAGGRPSLAKPYEDAGIKVFLHVPSTALLDMFLKEKARHFIFEGRESGGHVGPLSSMILWEKQIFRLLQEEDKHAFSVFFAGGIHDALSSAFISIMSTPLSTQGVKVGVLMGTSYLFTKEAVESGAIVKEYQKQILNHDRTMVLESAPGQETRAVSSPFTEMFFEEKKRLFSSGMDAKVVWQKLEELNIGRLRIAAKGQEIKGTEFISISEKDQREKGLYMIGDVASLRNKITTLEKLHEEVVFSGNKLISKLNDIPRPAHGKGVDIAIIGMAGVFPGAKTLEEYWRNLYLGRDSVTEVPDTRWNKEAFYNPDTRDTDFVCSNTGGFIPSLDFDPLEFGITPQSLASIEPVQLLSLLIAKRALQDAGYETLTEVEADNTSVIFGAEGATELASSYGCRAAFKQILGELPEEIKPVLPRLNENSFAGVLSNVISGRIANRLNLGGRNYTVDAACASSMAALDLGCQELVSKRSDMVILGGADFHNGINDYLMFNCTHALSKKGYSASFDADSDGIALGEGIGVLILKRKEDAELDGDRIYAVIKGVGGSSDGKSLGMTAPSKKGQIKALERAYKISGILPSEVGLIEAHGTGTVVGDKTELSALKDMFLDSGAVVGQTYLGSVKTQIGHAKCAAGIAGMIKAAYSVYYGVIPPTIHLNKPNAFYDPETSPFLFNTKAGIWNSERRVAGISAFGFGGTNFHAVIENHQTEVPQTTALQTWPSELFVFRGNKMEDAFAKMEKVKELLAVNDMVPLKNIAYSLAVENELDIQAVIVAGSIEELTARIDTVISGKPGTGIYKREVVDGKVAFLFPGQGSQRVDMARDLFVAFPAMRKLLRDNKEYERILFPEAVFDEKTKKELQLTITDTRNAQPLLGIVDIAIADYLRELGIEPDMVAGHSYGELPALCFAGVFSREELPKLSRERAQSILDAIEEDKGKMIATGLTEKELEDLLKDETEVWAVNYNSSKQIVLAGTTKGMQGFTEKLKGKNIGFKELNVACAFHSPLLKKSKELYKKVLKDVAFGKPNVTVWSNTTAAHYPEEEKMIKERLSEHLIKPVLFSRQLEQMYAEGARVFIEAGPGRVLIGLAQSTLEKDIAIIQTEANGSEGLTFLLQAIGRYLATGRKINFEKLFEDRGASIVQLDTPSQYKKNVTTWRINGHYSFPLFGKMPADGAYPITKPIKILNKSMETNTSGADEIMLEYLNGMKSMIQNQRDVMLGYFGQPLTVIQAPQQPTIQVAAAQPVAMPVQAEKATEQQEETGELPTATNLTLDQIKEILLDVVSDKTGYPIEMLGMDMDLEADLSIDSIKRLEIIGGLKEKMNFGEGMEEADGMIEQMASIKTLRGMISWIEELQNGSATTNTSAVEVKVEEKAGSESLNGEAPDQLSRYSFTLLPHPLDGQESVSVEGERFAIPVKGELTDYIKKMKNELAMKGVQAEIVSEKDKLESFDGIILLDTSFTSYFSIQELFNLLKKADMKNLKYIYIFNELNEIKNAQGFPGFVKTLAQEYSGLKARCITSLTPFDPNSLSALVTEEISRQDSSVDIIYKEGQRFHYSIQPDQIVLEEDSKLQLDKDSVVLVLGGAQGITPELVSQLAVDYPCNYVLVGRTAPIEDIENVYSLMKTKDEIRKFLIHKGELKKPADIEKKVQEIFKSNKIAEAVSKIEASGAKVSYKQADVKNLKNFKTFVKALKKEYGHIDGVIHSAGILEDKFFADKTLESFEQVYQTKVNPLYVILDELLDDLKLLVLFSSVTSVYGNKGQSDYAAANSVFDLTAQVLRDKTPARVVTFNWGPWKGAGMVSSSLEGEFKKRGVSLISLKEGGSCFVDELKYGKEPAVLVMGGSNDVDNFLKAQK